MRGEILEIFLANHKVLKRVFKSALPAKALKKIQRNDHASMTTGIEMLTLDDGP